MKLCYLAALCVFVSLIATGLSTICDSCWTIGGTQCCNSSSIQCPGKCIAVSQQWIEYGIQYKAFQKTCGNDYLCSSSCFRVTGPINFNVRINVGCGAGDYSNANLSYTECPLMEQNGLQCPVCYKNDTLDTCTPTGFVNCTGSETQCVNYVGQIQYSDTVTRNLSMQGCVAEGGCIFGFYGMPGAKQLILKKLECTNATKI